MATIAELREQFSATPEGEIAERVDTQQDALKEIGKIEDGVFSINEALANLRAIQVERAGECSVEFQAVLAALISSTHLDLLHGILSFPEA